MHYNFIFTAHRLLYKQPSVENDLFKALMYIFRYYWIKMLYVMFLHLYSPIVTFI